MAACSECGKDIPHGTQCWLIHLPPEGKTLRTKTVRNECHEE